MARSYSIGAAGWTAQVAKNAPADKRALRLAAMQLDMAHLGFGGMHLVEAALDSAIGAGLTLERFQEEMMPGRAQFDCQSGCANICKAARADGVVCPSDSCDIDDGVRLG